MTDPASSLSFLARLLESVRNIGGENEPVINRAAIAVAVAPVLQVLFDLGIDVGPYKDTIVTVAFIVAFSWSVIAGTMRTTGPVTADMISETASAAGYARGSKDGYFDGYGNGVAGIDPPREPPPVDDDYWKTP